MPVPTQWNWTDTVPKRTAYAALTGNGRTRDFAASVWNLIIDKVEEGRLYWDLVPYDLSSARMNSGDIMTAAKFNKVVGGVPLDYDWTWISTLHRKDIRSGDICYGRYFIALTDGINHWLSKTPLPFEIAQAFVLTMNANVSSRAANHIAYNDEFRLLHAVSVQNGISDHVKIQSDFNLVLSPTILCGSIDFVQINAFFDLAHRVNVANLSADYISILSQMNLGYSVAVLNGIPIEFSFACIMQMIMTVTSVSLPSMNFAADNNLGTLGGYIDFSELLIDNVRINMSMYLGSRTRLLLLSLDRIFANLQFLLQDNVSFDEMVVRPLAGENTISLTYPGDLIKQRSRRFNGVGAISVQTTEDLTPVESKHFDGDYEVSFSQSGNILKFPTKIAHSQYAINIAESGVLNRPKAIENPPVSVVPITVSYLGSSNLVQVTHLTSDNDIDVTHTGSVNAVLSTSVESAAEIEASSVSSISNGSPKRLTAVGNATVSPSGTADSLHIRGAEAIFNTNVVAIGSRLSFASYIGMEDDYELSISAKVEFDESGWIDPVQEGDILSVYQVHNVYERPFKQRINIDWIKYQEAEASTTVEFDNDTENLVFASFAEANNNILGISATNEPYISSWKYPKRYSDKTIEVYQSKEVTQTGDEVEVK